ncbi:serine protease [Streptomyces luteireticuli]|uniref:trypsin-like serine peptidase n=1 Tax=Streptomyces luteireticuli TaxID=173858 RepID=UPI00355925EC
MTPSRWSRSRWSRTLSIALAVAACGTTASVAVAAPTPPPAPTSTSAASDDLRAAEKYWTAERMSAAKPADDKGTPARAPRSAKAAGPPKGTPQGTLGDGLPMVGTFFYKSAQGDTSCSASVVKSPGKNLVLTAGHCAKPRDLSNYPIFVPQFRSDKDAGHQPFGVFPVQAKFVDPAYTDSRSTGQDSNLDFGFLRVGANGNGKVEDVVGGLRLTATPRMTNKVTVVGYPNDNNPGRKAVSCTTGTKHYQGYRQMELDCANLYRGVSGGPWIMNYDARNRTGDVIGIVGGSGGGGANHWTSYSPVFDQAIQRLYADAVNDRTPTGGPLRPQNSPVMPERAGIWSSARHLVTGDFDGDGRDDLVVVWKDGEATLYRGDGKGGFESGRRIADQGSALKRAVSVTGGTFTGSGHADLVVLWGDDKGTVSGKLSLFADVAKAGVFKSRESVLGKAGSDWKYAAKLVGGGFTSAARRNDLVAVYRDGEVGRFNGVGASGTGRETVILKKNDAWKGATAVTAARVSGRGGEDLLVRWPGGMLQACAGTDCNTRTTLQPGNTSTKDASVMAAGDFSSSGRRDDVVVRWSNGETSRYEGSTARGLGIWNPLVSP